MSRDSRCEDKRVCKFVGRILGEFDWIWMFAWRRKQSRREVNVACVKDHPHCSQQELSKAVAADAAPPSLPSSSLCQARAGHFWVRLPHSDVPTYSVDVYRGRHSVGEAPPLETFTETNTIRRSILQMRASLRKSGRHDALTCLSIHPGNECVINADVSRHFAPPERFESTLV